MDQAAPPPATAPPPGAETAPPVGLSTIFWIFFQIGALSFGGGLTAWLYREIVEKRSLMKGTEFMSAMTLAQVMPGINMTNMSVYVGQRLRGVQGALAAMLGLTLVPFFAIIAIGSVYERIRDIAVLHNFLDGVAATAVGLLLSMTVKSIKVTRMRPVQFVVAAVIALAVGVLRLPMVPVILLVAPVSIALVWPREPNEDEADGGMPGAGPHA